MMFWRWIPLGGCEASQLGLALSEQGLDWLLQGPCVLIGIESVQDSRGGQWTSACYFLIIGSVLECGNSIADTENTTVFH